MTKFLAVEKRGSVYRIHLGEAYDPKSIVGEGKTFQEGLVDLLEKSTTAGINIPSEVLEEFKTSQEHGHYTFFK